MTYHETPLPSQAERVRAEYRAHANRLRAERGLPALDFHALCAAEAKPHAPPTADQILAALDTLTTPGHAAHWDTDAHGVAWVRHELHGTFRGANVRDALTQLLIVTSALK